MQKYLKGSIPDICLRIDFTQQGTGRMDGAPTCMTIVGAIRIAAPLPVGALILAVCGIILCGLGSIQRTGKTVIAAIMYILAGLCLAVGVVLFISAIYDELGYHSQAAESREFSYYYGWSFYVAGSAFLSSELAAVLLCFVMSTFYIDPQVHYDRLVSRYANCTHVMGNLIIADLYDDSIDYDLSFLESIRYVSGFVAIYANKYPENVSLPNLERIRGNQTFRPSAVQDVANVSLLISMNTHDHVFMPKLKEISSGNVLIDLETSPYLCHLDTIDWTVIIRNGFAQVSSSDADCPTCAPECGLPDMGRYCWGPTADLCQQRRQECWLPCPNDLCLSDLPIVCCSQHCALGCFGHSPYNCTVCRDFTMADGRCSPTCPLSPPHVLNGGLSSGLMCTPQN
ncbi:hypothetical protein ACOMHN_067474 [Nucella lapillus]